MMLGIHQCEAGTQGPDERLAGLADMLKRQRLDLLVCPELFLSGYAEAQVKVLAEEQDGPFGRAVADLARAHGTAIAYGYPERAGDALFNSAALYDAQGALIANHRKRLPSPGSFEVESFARGSAVTFADLGGWRLAMIICYEVEFPESLRQAAQGGAQLVLVPTALGATWGVVAEKLVPTRAFENGVWIAYADHVGAFGGLDFFGGSRIVAPDGQDVAIAGRRPGLITAELDQDRVRAMQARLPYLADCGKLT